MSHASFRLLAMAAACTAAMAALAQDPRESYYYYEILQPKHEPKPQVEGFAAERVKERLGRGLAAVPAEGGKGVYLSWRLLESDGPGAAFHVWREAGGKAKRLTRKPVTRTCDFTDADPVANAVYRVKPAGGGGAEGSVAVALDSLKPYTSIRLKGGGHAGKLALADLDGDGTYDFIVRTPASNVDPGMPGDRSGTTYKISAYLSDGTWLWTHDLGPGIEPGVWYSPFVAYDFDGDGRAEVALKTAGSDYVKNAQGRVCGGSEFLTVLDGMTGREVCSVPWPERNDRYGNLVRQNRNQMGVAFLDGKTPYILAARGTYKLMVVDAHTGRLIWGIGHTTYHVGNGMVADFDPAHPGLECFASEDKKGGSTAKYLLTADGEKIDAPGGKVPGCYPWVWWDADLLRETFAYDGGWGRQKVWKWQGDVLAEGIEGHVLATADLDGDWREEIVTALDGEIRVYRTNIPAADRRTTLMQDPLYRSYIMHGSMGYPQSPVPSFYLGE